MAEKSDVFCPTPLEPSACAPLRSRSLRRSRGNKQGTEASVSKPDTPGFAPDPAAAEIASCGPERFVAAADPVAALTAIGSSGTSGMRKRECQDFS